MVSELWGDEIKKGFTTETQRTQRRAMGINHRDTERHGEGQWEFKISPRRHGEHGEGLCLLWMHHRDTESTEKRWILEGLLLMTYSDQRNTYTGPKKTKKTLCHHRDAERTEKGIYTVRTGIPLMGLEIGRNQCGIIST